MSVEVLQHSILIELAQRLADAPSERFDGVRVHITWLTFKHI